MHYSTAARVHQSMHLQLARISGGAVLGVGVLRGRGVHGIFESVIIFCRLRLHTVSWQGPEVLSPHLGHRGV